MSLVNDALRKARLEAARQDSSRLGTPYPGWLATERPSKANGRLILGTAVVIGVILTVGGLLYWTGLRFGRGQTPPPAELAENKVPIATRPAEKRTVADSANGLEKSSTNNLSASVSSTAGSRADPMLIPPPPAAAIAERSSPVSRPVAERSSATSNTTAVDPVPIDPPSIDQDKAVREAARTQRSVEATPPPAQPEPAVSTRSADRSTDPQTLAPGPDASLDTQVSSATSETPQPEDSEYSPQDSPPVAAKVFLREANIDGVGNLKIGGIAWSEDRPFALINSQVLGLGDSILGLSVVAVEKRQVVLRHDDGTRYVLQLR